MTKLTFLNLILSCLVTKQLKSNTWGDTGGQKGEETVVGMQNKFKEFRKAIQFDL